CACAVAICLVKSGRVASALAILLAHSAYLRISEVVGLRVCDVAIAKDPRLPSSFKGVALRLVKTKTGVNQWARVTITDTQRLLTEWLAARAARDYASTRSLF